MMPLEMADLPPDRVEGEVVATFFFQDQRPPLGPAALLDWRLNGLLSRLLVAGDTVGTAGEQIAVPNNGKLNADWVLFIGGGQWAGLGRATYRSLVEHLLQSCRRAGFSRIALCLEPLADMTREELKKLAAAALEEVGGAELECRLCS